MSRCFRNLALLALICVTAYSLSISSDVHRRSTQHMLRIHKKPYHLMNHHQEVNSSAYVEQIGANLDSIQGSIDSKTPSIIETKQLPPFEYNSTTCEALSQEDKDSLSEKAQSVRQQIQSLLESLEENPQVQSNASNADKYLETVQGLLASECEDVENVVIAPTVYQTNINTKRPWILGDITFNDLIKNYVSRLEENDNVTNCGDLTPFFTGSACIACEDPTPIFDISAGECTTCPEGSNYDALTKNCVVAKVYKPNPAARDNALVNPLGPDGQLDDYMNGEGEGETCPEDKPFVAGGECISCPEETPDFAIEIEECVRAVKPHSSVSDNLLLGEDQPEEDKDKYMNQTGEECPEQKPFVENYQCVECPSGLFDLEKQQCAGSLKKPNPAASDRIVAGEGQGPDDLDNYMNQDGEECPEETPFATLTECISCPEQTPYFNIQDRECVVARKPNPAAEDNTVAEDDQDVQDYMDQNGDECPEETPFVQANECIACPEQTPYFSVDTEECVDAVKPSASAEPNVMIGPGGNPEDVDGYMNQKGRECPEQTPFVKDMECISCPEQTPFFNIDSKECESCENFDSETHTCPGPKKPHPSAESRINMGDETTEQDVTDYLNQEGEDCPEDKPFASKDQCIECPEDKPFYDLVAEECVPGNPEATDVSAHSDKLMMNDQSTDEDWNNYVAENQDKVLCPDETPFWNKEECIACEDPTPYFNVIKYECDACPGNLVLNPDTHKCDSAEPLDPDIMDLFNAIF